MDSGRSGGAPARDAPESPRSVLSASKPGHAEARTGATQQTNGAPDHELFERFRDGDVAAFETLLRRHRRTIHAFISRYLRDRQQADDVYQEVLLRVVARADDFRGSSKFTTWLFSIARNLCIDAARRAVHRDHVSLDQPGQGGAAALVERVASQRPGVDRDAIARELRRRVHDALGTLPEEQLEVFLLRETDCLSFGEIAVVVGAPEATVKSRMRYALGRLRDALADFEDYARALR
ncbi:MAG: RNA polymerase sigma factor [Deltaproteobacteria bacterium]|nr:RNA polymerase sigma factor [Deltaproteobacteria bacterium]